MLIIFRCLNKTNLMPLINGLSFLCYGEIHQQKNEIEQMRNPKKIEENSQQLLGRLPQLAEADLSTLIAYHNKKYFVDADPEISDAAFDKLVLALKFINPRSLILSQIEEEASFRDEIVHQRPMLSLDKCYDAQSFFKWTEKIKGNLVAMPKIDGVACSLIYSPGGKLVEAATRGDGRVGENITKNIRMIEDIPLSLPKLASLSLAEGQTNIEIRGEVFFPLARFKQGYAEDFANPRNLAAGALKQKEQEKSKNYGLRFFPYDIRGTMAKSEAEKFEVLKQCNFVMMPWHLVDNDDKATEIYYAFEKERSSFDYEIDGVVFRANDINDQIRLGETAHHPRYAIAFKFHGESAQTELLKVEWSVSRSGAITPVAIVNPVFVSGATISRASLHNLGIFQSLGLCEDTLVEINRRGGVIPHVERVLMRKGSPLSAPTECPSCQHPVMIAGDFLFCGDKKNCEEVVVARLMHFSQLIGIEGMGEKIVRKLFSHGLLKQFKDIYCLSAQDLSSLERMGELSASKLMAEISQKKTLDLAIFLRALGIDDVGNNIAELIAMNFFSLDKIRHLSVDDLVAIHGIGERIAFSLVEGLRELHDEIDVLLNYVVVDDFKEHIGSEDASNPLYAKNFLFTGKMAHMDRKSAQDLVKKLGGKAPGAMSEKIDFLVIGDEGSALLGQGNKSTKHKAADKLVAQGSSLKIITESEFLKMAKS